MTEFEDIDDFISRLEKSQIENQVAQGLEFTGEQQIEKEINRLHGLDKDKLSEENQTRLEARLTALKQVRGGEIG